MESIINSARIGVSGWTDKFQSAAELVSHLETSASDVRATDVRGHESFVSACRLLEVAKDNSNKDKKLATHHYWLKLSENKQKTMKRLVQNCIYWCIGLNRTFH